jgi:hypothetical protein
MFQATIAPNHGKVSEKITVGKLDSMSKEELMVMLMKLANK